jgi:hypothetical protein
VAGIWGACATIKEGKGKLPEPKMVALLARNSPAASSVMEPAHCKQESSWLVHQKFDT